MKKLGLALALFFVCTQVLALLHMAEHGFEEHEHKGHTCSIYLAGEQSQYCASERPVAVSRLDFVLGSISFFVQTATHSQDFFSVSPRAPPVFLLS
ncbi:MAG: hypothetical protein KKE83_09105 [Proteobacteria bacterium]|nr:hypothetical protein [Pseudomonadota bacterium]MBU1547507.1 hypothetical protein [Pseudomonadota bacterium]MBU2619831.1 hypothetical protein [Pseudomonadota bacterium]